MNPSRFIAMVPLALVLSIVVGCQGSDRESEAAGASTTTSGAIDTVAIRTIAEVAAKGMVSTQMQYVYDPGDAGGWYIADWKLTYEGKPLLVRGASLSEGGDCSINYEVMALNGQVSLLRSWVGCAVDMPQTFEVDSVFFTGGEPIVAHHSIEEPSTEGTPGKRSRSAITKPGSLSCAKQYADGIMKADVKAIAALQCSIE